MLSKKTKYGIKALTYLCSHPNDAPIPIGRIAEHENIPLKFLEAILVVLKNAGLVASKKGKNGGYFIVRNPKDILMSEIIRLLNGPIAMVPCVSLNYYKKCDDCPDEVTCGVNRLMLEVRNNTLKVLGAKSLLELTLETKGGQNAQSLA